MLKKLYLSDLCDLCGKVTVLAAMKNFAKKTKFGEISPLRAVSCPARQSPVDRTRRHCRWVQLAGDCFGTIRLAMTARIPSQRLFPRIQPLPLLLPLLLTTGLLAHEFYVSICKIKFDPETHSLAVSFRIFTNDLEDALAARSGERRQLGEEKDDPATAQQIADYIGEKVAIKVNDRPVALIFVQTRNDFDAVECIFRADSIDTVQKLFIHDEILTDRIDAQTNIVRLNINGAKKYLNLNKQLADETVAF